MINRELLGGTISEPLTLTVQPYSLGRATIGNQTIYPFDSYSMSSPPVVMDYSVINDLSAMIEVYMDGRVSLQGYIVENMDGRVSLQGYIVENINVIFWGMEHTSTWLRGYIIDKTKNSSITWQEIGPIV